MCSICLMVPDNNAGDASVSMCPLYCRWLCIYIIWRIPTRCRKAHKQCISIFIPSDDRMLNREQQSAACLLYFGLLALCERGCGILYCIYKCYYITTSHIILFTIHGYNSTFRWEFRWHSEKYNLGFVNFQQLWGMFSSMQLQFKCA